MATFHLPWTEPQDSWTDVPVTLKARHLTHAVLFNLLNVHYLYRGLGVAMKLQSLSPLEKASASALLPLSEFDETFLSPHESQDGEEASCRESRDYYSTWIDSLRGVSSSEASAARNDCSSISST